ncbi:uncharacterized protein LOC116295621 [Actinia tenebrosa]|uniref:Microtubule-associated protein Jupiter n=1 Tax=Actinia tenebrosa TaxID=6105 RepID=A0A6P8HVG6_ACTTE|nr:uncharacterized protein LOC116295621 [Actinia tenebrosa]
MSSEFVVGFDDSHRQSRVLAPPGGKDSVSFAAAQASDPSGKPLNPCQVQRNSSNVFEASEMGIQSKGNVKSCQEARQKSSVFTAPLEPIPVPKKAHQEKSSGNIIAATEAAPEKIHTSVQVKAPPGGVSHISFG